MIILKPTRTLTRMTAPLKVTTCASRFPFFNAVAYKYRCKVSALAYTIFKVKWIIKGAPICKKFSILGSAAVFVNTSSSGTHSQLSKNEIAAIIKKADALFDENKFEELLQLLRPYKDSGVEELIWRLARAAFKVSIKQGLSKADYTALVEEAYCMAKLALDLNDKSACAHKWMSIVLDAYSAQGGFKKRCLTIVPVKEHMKKSYELDPSDATVMYMLGMWYYGVADLAWYQRQIVSAIVSHPPSATFEEALTYFKKAEETSPNFYSLNLLMLGKCHLKLGDTDSAALYLQQAVSYPKCTEDDHKAHKEASELLAKLKKKK